MPHIVLNQKIDLQDFSKKFSPIFQNEKFIVKVVTIFVDKDNLTALLPAVAISNINQQYLIELSTRKSKTTIRLYPGTDPEKSDAVKLSMALLAKQIIHHYPYLEIGKTNLSDYLEMVTVS